MKKENLVITGISCASCAARIEKTLQNLPGIESAGVNFAAGKAYVDYAPNLPTFPP